MMMITSPFGQLGVWASSSGVQDVFTYMAPTILTMNLLFFIVDLVVWVV
jgi:hypothetical protein